MRKYLIPIIFTSFFSAFPALAKAQGIDFFAFARGQQMANDMAYQQRMREYQMQQQQMYIQSMREERIVKEYVASVNVKRFHALSQGLTQKQFQTAQSEYIRQDPQFQNFPYNVQSRIIEELLKQGIFN